MTRIFLGILILSLVNFSATAQTREELERQRQQLKREIDATEKLLNANKAQTKENFLQWTLINNKVNLQNKVVDNMSKDLRVLDNNIYTMQLDVNKYGRMLDTLKEEYAKSMVYAYKNRSNYDFLNFIFSADNFNDAIKRIAYLKSYRSYREMQGQNILRTQELRKKKINDLSTAKLSKGVALRTQSSEKEVLEQQKQEKDKIVASLKAQGSKLSSQISSKQRQMKKVDNVIAAAIRKAIDDAKRIAAAKAAEEKRLRDAEAKRLRLEEDARKKAEADRLAAERKNNPTATQPEAVIAKVTTPAAPKAAAPVVKETKYATELLNSGNIALNTSFERNKGSLPWPVDQGAVLMHFGNNKMPSGSTLTIGCTTITSAVGSAVKSVFDGEVLVVTNIDVGIDAVVIKHGRYFTTYSNINGVTVHPGDQVRTGQVIGKVAENIDGVGAVDFYMANEKSDFDPESWLRNR